jgi:hypothetical protein
MSGPLSRAALDFVILLHPSASTTTHLCAHIPRITDRLCWDTDLTKQTMDNLWDPFEGSCMLMLASRL